MNGGLSKIRSLHPYVSHRITKLENGQHITLKNAIHMESVSLAKLPDFKGIF